MTEGNVDGYWSSGDEKEKPIGQNFCLMARVHVDCEDGYYSSGDEEEESDEEKKKNYCYMANNNPEGRSIIEQVRNLLLLNNCDTALCEPYLTKIETHLADALRAYQRAIEDREEIFNELTRLRSRHEDRKLRIDSLERELMIAKDECIIVNDKCNVSVRERNILLADNVRLNNAIDKIYSSIDKVESFNNMTHNFRYPWSKTAGLGSRKPTPDSELSNLSFMGDIPNIKYPESSESSLSTSDSDSETTQSPTSGESANSLAPTQSISETLPAVPMTQSFTPIRIACPPPTTIPQSNLESSTSPVVSLPNNLDRSNCVVEEIPSTSGKQSDSDVMVGGSIWASIDTDEQKDSSYYDQSSDSSFSDEDIVPRSYNNQKSKVRYQPRLVKKPWLNTKDIVTPKKFA